MHFEKIRLGLTNLDLRPPMAHYRVHLACQSQVCEMQHFSMAFFIVLFQNLAASPSLLLLFTTLKSHLPAPSDDTLRVKMPHTNSKYFFFLVVQIPLLGDIV